MEILDDAWRRNALPPGGVGTVGNFDGVHLGQQAVIDRAVRRAGALAVPAIVVTFEPHPLAFLRPESAPPRLVTAPEKARLLAERGVDFTLVVSFDAQVAATSAREFAASFLFGRLDLVEVYVGAGFVFGRDREGDVDVLRRLAAERGRLGMGVDEVLLDGDRVSSTRIRAALQTGDVELAARLLGRPYKLTGQVVGGAGQCRGLGWPTINLAPDEQLTPGRGVYTTRVVVDGRSLPAVTNIGVRPTLHRADPLTIETHILDFADDLYDHAVGLTFDRRLRDERRFASVEELVAQIGRDVACARDFYGLPDNPIE